MNTTEKIQSQAIKAALTQDWAEAIRLNQEILKDESNHIPTLNRLGFAYMQSGQIKQAKSTYQSVIDIDRFNPIAQKSLEKLQKIKSNISPTPTNGQVGVFTTTFLEEPGKTKTVTLVRPTTTSRIVSLNPGTPVELICKKKGLTVETPDGDYVGSLPDDIGFRLAKLIKCGYTYQTVIKNCQNKSISVFIRETTRPPVNGDLVSFPANGSFKSLGKLITPSQSENIPVDVTPTGEEDDSDD